MVTSQDAPRSPRPLSRRGRGEPPPYDWLGRLSEERRLEKVQALSRLTEEELGAHCSSILTEVSRLALERMREIRERG